MDDSIKWIIMFFGAYFLGAVSFAFMLGKVKGIDIRMHGSGNVGASNVGRLLGRKFGMACFTLDVLKGFLPVVLAGLWLGLLDPNLFSDTPLPSTAVQKFLWIGVGVAAILGHMFSIFLGFKGGKGVATGFGAMLGLYPHLTWPVLGALVVWLVVVKVGRMIALSSMLAACSLPLWYLVMLIPRHVGTGGPGNADDPGAAAATFGEQFTDGWPFLLATTAMAVLIVWKHRANIGRILAGTEPRVGRPQTQPLSDPPS